MVDIETVGDQAYLATNIGIVVMDVSSPTSPTVLWTIPDSADTNYLGSWGNQVCGQSNRTGPGGDYLSLDVYDPAHPSNPTILASVEVRGYELTLDGRRAFVSQGKGIDVVDLNDPSAPVLTASTYDLETIGRLSVSGSLVSHQSGG